MKKYITKDSDIRERVDKFLTRTINIPRNKIQNLIKDDLASINNQIIKANYKLKEGDVVEVKEKIKKVEEKKKIKNLPQPEIIEVTDEYIVINKPAGLIVHGGEHIKEDTLVDFLLNKWPELSRVGEDPARPSIVHRLDKEVSGLMVIARTEASFENLKEQFKNRDINKNYTALVYGQVSKDDDEINFRIKRSTQGFKMAAIPTIHKGKKNMEGRYAATQFKITKKFINYTLLELKIITGRTHQIRVHMSAYGHPIVGDNLYARREQKLKNEKLKLGRIFLFANNLEFKNLAGEIIDHSVEMPPKLTDLLGKIK